MSKLQHRRRGCCLRRSQRNVTGGLQPGFDQAQMVNATNLLFAFHFYNILQPLGLLSQVWVLILSYLSQKCSPTAFLCCDHSSSLEKSVLAGRGSACAGLRDPQGIAVLHPKRPRRESLQWAIASECASSAAFRSTLAAFASQVRTGAAASPPMCQREEQGSNESRTSND